MPSDKRQRQREASRARQQAVAAAQQRSKLRRRIAFIVVLVVLFGGAIFWATQGDDDETDLAATTTTTSLVTRKGNANECPPARRTSRRFTAFDNPPIMCIDPAKKYSAEIETDVGTIEIELNAQVAPKTVNNFVFLARNRYYDGIIFHRVIPDFMDQTGDPQGTGTGGPGYQFEDEIPAGYTYSEGDVAMANSGPNTNGSQFFLVASETGAKTLLEAVGGVAKYTPFGRVTEGLSVVKRINRDGSASGTPEKQHRMISVTITEE